RLSLFSISCSEQDAPCSEVSSTSSRCGRSAMGSISIPTSSSLNCGNTSQIRSLIRFSVTSCCSSLCISERVEPDAAPLPQREVVEVDPVADQQLVRVGDRHAL